VSKKTGRQMLPLAKSLQANADAIEDNADAVHKSARELGLRIEGIRDALLPSMTPSVEQAIARAERSHESLVDALSDLERGVLDLRDDAEQANQEQDAEAPSDVRAEGRQ
jgi:prefoldin subunit 5